MSIFLFVATDKSAPYFHVRIDVKSLFGINGRSTLFDLQKNPIDTFSAEDAVLYENLAVKETENKSFMFFYDHIH